MAASTAAVPPLTREPRQISPPDAAAARPLLRGSEKEVLQQPHRAVNYHTPANSSGLLRM